MSTSIPGADRSTLLHLARGSLVARLRGDPLEHCLDGVELTPALRQRRGLFATLKSRSDGSLRGCIGVLEPAAPLYRAVIETTPKAAFEDPRFPPLTEPELPQVAISLSLLSPLRLVEDADEIVVGCHGVELRHGSRRAVFLPQVAVEQGWDRGELLEQLALKAGLERDAWREANLAVFEAEAFGEAD